MPQDDAFTTIVKIIFGLIIAGAMFNAFVMPKLIAWWEVNGWIVITVLIILAAVGGGLFLVWLLRDSIFGRNSSYTYSRDYSSGSYSYPSRISSPGVHSIGLSTPAITNDVAPDPSITMLNAVTTAIQSFEPFRQYKFENQYQIDLARHLSEHFNDVKLEQQIRSSRPDIVVGKIAIEIKGPTTTRSLQTISDKILRYYNNFDSVVIVLFNIQMTEEHYDEWLEGIKEHYPRVKVVRKGL